MMGPATTAVVSHAGLGSGSSSFRRQEHAGTTAVSSSSSPYTPPKSHVNGEGSEDEGSDFDAVLFAGRAAPPAFATSDTLPTCARHMEPVLRDLGLQQWQLGGGDPVAALNRLHELVQLYQGLQQSKEALQDQLTKARLEVKSADKTIQRLQAQAEAKEQELGGLNIKVRQLEAWCRDESERWAAERDELVRRSTGFEQRHVQFQHELRRRDAEHERLQKHLGSVLAAAERRRGGGSSTGSGGTSAGPGASRGPRISGGGRPPAAGSGPPDTKRMSKGELEDLHKRTLEAFEAERQGLQGENGALRKALQSLEREHMELLNSTHTGSRSSSASGALPALQPEASGGSNSSSDGLLPAEDAGADPTAAAAAGAGPGARAAAAAANAADPDPAAALQRMQTHLLALKLRKQRITGGAPLSQLQEQAESAAERLLLAKLQEAGRIMEEQQAALATALTAIATSPGRHG